MRSSVRKPFTAVFTDTRGEISSSQKNIDNNKSKTVVYTEKIKNII